MFYHDIIIHQVLSEKSANAESANNKYTFIVDKRANKFDIAGAIKKIFSVNVLGVNIVNIKPTLRKFRGKIGKTSSFKKAIVTIDSNSKLDLVLGGKQ